MPVPAFFIRHRNLERTRARRAQCHIRTVYISRSDAVG